MDERVDLDEERDPKELDGASASSSRGGRLSLSPRLTYLLIGGAALGLIVVMCLIVALVAALQST